MEPKATVALSVEVDRDGLNRFIADHKERCEGRLLQSMHLDGETWFVNVYTCTGRCGQSVSIESARNPRRRPLERIYVVQPSERKATDGNETTVST